MSVINKTLQGLTYSVAEGIPVPHAFTTRLGGVSSGHLASLNLGTARGDDPANVVQNYSHLGCALGFEPRDVVMATQTHSDIVLAVSEKDRGAGLMGPKLPECDALITNTAGLALFVSTADCTPVLLYDPVTGAVGAAHAGWRGTASAIAEKTALAMASIFGCDPKNLRCAIGPNIGPCHFETDGEVPEAMVAQYGRDALAHIQKRGEKYYLDLKAINALALARAGVVHIEQSADCTACQPGRYWSHRVTRGNRGAQGAIIVCKEAIG